MMNWDAIEERIADDEKTNQSEAIAIIRELLSYNINDENQALFDAGLMAYSLVDLHDLREASQLWEKDEKELLAYLMDLYSYDDYHDTGFDQLIIRLIDRKNHFFETYARDYEFEWQCFKSIAEVLAILPEIEEKVKLWELKKEQEQRDIERRKKESEPPPLNWREQKVQERIRKKLKAVLLFAFTGSVIALTQLDMVFLFLAFILLFETAFVYGLEIKRHVENLEQLPAHVIAMIVLTPIIGIITFVYHVNSSGYNFDDYPKLDLHSTIRSYEETFRDKNSLFPNEVFISGVVSRKNEGHGSHDKCAIYYEYNFRAKGDDPLLIEVKDGFIEVRDHIITKNSKSIYLNWPSEGSSANTKLCLEIGKQVSIRGYIYGVKSNSDDSRKVWVSASQIYPGSTASHQSYWLNKQPSVLWYKIMSKVSLFILLIQLFMILYYGSKWFSLHLAKRNNPGQRN